MKSSRPLNMEDKFASSSTPFRARARSLFPKVWLPASALAVLLAGCHKASAPAAPAGFQVIGEGNPPQGTLIYDGQGNLVGKVLGADRMHHFTDGSDDGPAIKVESTKTAGGAALFLTPFHIATSYYKKIGATPAPLSAAEIAMVPSISAGAPPPRGGAKPEPQAGGAAPSSGAVPLKTIAPVPVSAVPQ